MARLEYIRLPLERAFVENGAVRFKCQEVVDPRTRLRMPVAAERMPQIVWHNGEFWGEANLWLLRRTKLLLSGELKEETIGANGKDLLAYAQWLEDAGKEWWQCPIRDDERPLNLYRGFLVASAGPETPESSAQTGKGPRPGVLSPLLASRRMSTVKAFYRWLLSQEILSPGFQLWTENKIRIPYDTEDRPTKAQMDDLLLQCRNWKPLVRGTAAKMDRLMSMWFAWIWWTETKHRLEVKPQTWQRQGIPYATSSAPQLIIPIGVHL